jgi:hypothetical protein
MVRQKSMRQQAKELQISPSYLSMIMSGQRNCPPELNERIQSITGFHSLVNSEQNQLQGMLPKQKVASSNLVSRSTVI